MTVSIHQPQYMPWLPFFDKIDNSDIFVYLDNVQYHKNGVQNRNKIKTANGAQWITIPVKKSSLETKICDIAINGNIYKKKHIKSITQNYNKAEYFNDYLQVLTKIIECNYKYLVDLNIDLCSWIISELNIETKVIKASSLDLNYSSSNLLLELCKKLGAKTYLSGSGGKNYLDENIFTQNNIKVVYQDYQYINYKQCWEKIGFIDQLSIIDLLFNVGPIKSKEILLKGRKILK